MTAIDKGALEAACDAYVDAAMNKSLSNLEALEVAGPSADELRAAAALIVALQDELEEARGALRYCEGQWSDERGTMIDKIQSERARAEAAEAEVVRLRKALTPSANTKTAYIKNFSFPITLYLGHEEETRQVTVPWTTIKEIMAAIRARAATGKPE